MNSLRKAISIITVLTVLCTCFSVLPAEAALPSGLQDVYTIFTTGNLPSGTGPDTSSCKNGLAYASWSSPDFILSYNGGTVGGVASPGIALAPVSYYPNGAFIEYAAAGTGMDTNLHWMKVTANNSTLGSFRLTQLVVQGAGNGDPGTYNIIATKVGGGTVQTGNTAFNMNTINPPLTIDLTTTPLAGQQLTAFEIDFTMSGSTPRPADFTFQTFTISNAHIPVPPPTVTGISPTSGPTVGGTSVTITGTNLTDATSVTIGGAAATGITVISATSITATTPAGTAGAKDVVVTTTFGGTGTGTGLFTYTPPSATLTVTISGNGSVNSQNQTGTNYACNSGTCSPVTFGYNDTVTLTPTGSNSTFSVWSGNYSGTSNPGSITMNGDKAVTATFTPDPARVRIEGDPTTRYYSLGTALAAPATDEEIRAQGAPNFSETITSTNSHNLKLRGGFSNPDFSDVSRTGYSTLTGWLKIQAGKLTAERLKIKAP